MSEAQDIIEHVRTVTDRNRDSHAVPDECPMCLTVDRLGPYLWLGSGRARHCQHCGTVWGAHVTNSTEPGREEATRAMTAQQVDVVEPLMATCARLTAEVRRLRAAMLAIERDTIDATGARDMYESTITTIHATLGPPGDPRRNAS